MINLKYSLAGVSRCLVYDQSDLPPHHHRRQLRFRRFPRNRRPDSLAVAEDRDAVGQRQNLFEFVRNKDDGLAFFDQ